MKCKKDHTPDKLLRLYQVIISIRYIQTDDFTKTIARISSINEQE